VDQLFLGTLLFTVSAFLFPTVLTYAGLFYMVRFTHRLTVGLRIDLPRIVGSWIYAVDAPRGAQLVPAVCATVAGEGAFQTARYALSLPLCPDQPS
jgi:hypothetical protein